MTFPPGNSLQGFADLIAANRERLRPADEFHPFDTGEVTAPGRGSDDAKIRALAVDLVRRRGGSKASQLADLLVKCVQEEMRK